MNVRSACAARRKSRRGAIVILVAISMFAVVGFMAICIDGGALLERRRHAQAAADAAALAAAEDLFRAFPSNQGFDLDGSARQAAQRVAALNGFDDKTSSAEVEVRTAPELYRGGPNASLAIPPGYVEITVQYNQDRHFSRIFGAGKIPVQARAVARGTWEAADVAIHVLDLHAPAALKSTGESFVHVRGSKIIVNSSASDAASTTGGTIIAPVMDITGGTSVSGTKGGFEAEINYGVLPSPDPLRHIPEPDAAQFSVQSNRPIHVSNGTRTLQPGVYAGGITVSGRGNLQLQPGIYIMDGGGFKFSGQGTLNAEGVMIFNAPKLSSHVVSITGTGETIMSPPDATIYKGLTLFQARKSTNTMSVSGGGFMDISGTFYTANGTLQVGGGGDGRVGSQYISRLLDIVGSGGLVIDYIKDEAIPVRTFHLVE